VLIARRRAPHEEQRRQNAGKHDCKHSKRDAVKLHGSSLSPSLQIPSAPQLDRFAREFHEHAAAIFCG
jgi:hypothetical protein